MMFEIVNKPVHQSWPFCIKLYHESVIPNGGDYYRMHPYKTNVCRRTSTATYSGEAEMHCTKVTNLVCSLKTDSAAPLFDVMGQYGETGAFMVILTAASDYESKVQIVTSPSRTVCFRL